MANALSYGMPQQEDNPLSPIPSAPTFGMKPKPQMGAANASMPQPLKKGNALVPETAKPYADKRKTAPAQLGPRNSVSTNALAAFMPQQQKPDGMHIFMDTLQQTMDPAAAEARRTRMTAEQQQKLGQGLAFIQQMRAIPEEQRMEMARQGIGQFGLGDIQIPEGGLTDAELDKGIATLSAHLGIAPTAPEYMNLGGGNVGMVQNGKFSLAREAPQEAKPTWEEVNGRIIDVNDPTKVLADYSDQDQPSGADWQQFTDASGQLWEYQRGVPGSERKVEVPRGRVPGADGGGSNEGYRPATPQELQAWGIPEGTPVKINIRTGEPQVISGAKPSSEYTPSQQSKFIQQAQTLDAVEGAINAYLDLIDTNGTQMWTTGTGGDNPVAKQLDAARTAILIQAKELFNLGVLNGPDLEIISAAVPGVTGFDALGKSRESVAAQLSVLSDYIARGRNQIPPELLQKARPQSRAPTAPVDIDALLDEVTSAIPGGYEAWRQREGLVPAPAGVSPEIWDEMTPEERAAFE